MFLEVTISLSGIKCKPWLLLNNVSFCHFLLFFQKSYNILAPIGNALFHFPKFKQSATKTSLYYANDTLA